MCDQILVLAATGDRLEAAARYLSRPGSSREYLIVLLFAAVIAAIWGILFVWDRLRKLPAEGAQPRRTLFEQLCAAHQLDPRDVAGLTAAAQECRMASPALLFVQPEHLDRLGGEGQPTAEDSRRLRQRLYGAL